MQDWRFASGHGFSRVTKAATTYDSVQVYEFLFPDGKTRKFYVVGQSE
jgi:hypothetical protein